MFYTSQVWRSSYFAKVTRFNSQSTAYQPWGYLCYFQAGLDSVAATLHQCTNMPTLTDRAPMCTSVDVLIRRRAPRVIVVAWACKLRVTNTPSTNIHKWWKMCGPQQYCSKHNRISWTMLNATLNVGKIEPIWRCGSNNIESCIIFTWPVICMRGGELQREGLRLKYVLLVLV